jgi:hypothetical protein
MTAPTPPPPETRFKVLCCRARRSVSPTGVLICMSCDAGLEIPRTAELSDVPAGETRWPPRP